MDQATHNKIVSFIWGIAERFDSRFADYLLRDRSMVAQYLTASKGVGSIQRNLYWPHLKRAVVPVPPKTEQAAITEHLDGALGDLSNVDEPLSREES